MLHLHFLTRMCAGGRIKGNITALPALHPHPRRQEARGNHRHFDVIFCFRVRVHVSVMCLCVCIYLKTFGNDVLLVLIARFSLLLALRTRPPRSRWRTCTNGR